MDEQPRESRRRRSSSGEGSSGGSRRAASSSSSRKVGWGALGAAVAFGAIVGAGVMFTLVPGAPPPEAGAPARSSATTGEPGEGAYSNGGAAGYLAPGAVRPLKFLPQPPAAGSPQAESDKQVFLATRKLAGTPRWSLAQKDSDQSVAATLANFGCAVGVDLGPASAPATDALLERFARDQAPVIEAAKAGFKRSRPFLSNPGEICIPKTDQLARSPDYPSGHAAWGWAVALILAEAAPERADQIIARGRSYGESRVVCGAHSASAVDAGRVVGAAMVSAVHVAPGFRNDLETARLELASLRRSGKTLPATACAAEASLIGGSAY